jgi:hypothetical protein
METIKLNNNQEFEIIPMGIDTNLFEKTRKFSFISTLGYGEIETAFNTENINKIEYLSASDELLKTYDDCVSLKMLSKEFNKQVEDKVIADVYTVVLGLA